MATKTNVKNKDENSQKSVANIKALDQEQFSKEGKANATYAAIKKALALVDLTKNETRTYNVFSKDRLRNFMQNPKTNENNLRALSQFLYRMSHPYRRLIKYYANMFDFNAYTVLPLIAVNEEPNEQDVLNRYQEALIEMEKMNLSDELSKALTIVWREDTFFGYTYEDDESFYIMPLDGNYCKVSSVNFDGTLNFAFDFSFFRQGTNAAFLEYWDKEFNKKYNSFLSDSSLRWQELDNTRTIVLKNNDEDPTLSLPPFLSIFEAIIDLVDLQALQSVKEELKNYKLLVNKIPLIGNSDTVDDFAVDLDTAVDFYNQLVATLPDLVGACISPLEITPIDFKDSKTTEDVDTIARSLNNLFSMSGTSSMLFINSDSSVGLKNSIIADTQMAQPLLKQIETWVNRKVRLATNDNLIRIKYIDIFPFNREDKIKEIKEGATLGVSIKMAYAAVMGYTPLEALSADFLENKALKLHERWIPLKSSYTQSGEQGAPEKDEGSLTDEGTKSKDGEKNLK